MQPAGIAIIAFIVVMVVIAIKSNMKKDDK